MLEQLPSDEAGLVEMGLITPEECVSNRPMPASLAATNYGPLYHAQYAFYRSLYYDNISV